MTSFIEINNLQIMAFHGVLEQEHTVGNLYRIDCKLQVDISKAMSSDEVSDTINYAEVVLLIQNEMKQPSQLLEHVAGRIVQAIQQHWKEVEGIDFSLQKLCPPIANADIESCGVHIIV